MCPPSYHHNGFMTTPEIGLKMYGYTLWEGLHCGVTRVLKIVSSERCIMQIVNVQQGNSPPNPSECSNCTDTDTHVHVFC